MSYTRVGVVTGANKGIGLAAVRQLALQYPRSPLNNGPFLIYLTARDKTKGEAAVKSLEEDAQLKNAKALKVDGGLSDITFHQLDIMDSGSIRSFADHLKQVHSDGIDFVINNAGFVSRDLDTQIAKTTLDCNYYGTLETCHALLPLLKPTGRIINVASMAGRLIYYTDEIRNRFLVAKTEEDFTLIMKDFTAAVEAGKVKEAGFPPSAYAVSKAGLIGATKVMARQERERGNSILINACCPGFVNTGMSLGEGTKTPDEGAQTPVMLAIQDIKGQTGEFWQNEKLFKWCPDT